MFKLMTRIAAMAGMLLAALPAAHAGEKEDCEWGGGRWVTQWNGGVDGFCYRNIVRERQPPGPTGTGPGATPSNAQPATAAPGQARPFAPAPIPAAR
jgi:hypothetical protein